MTTTTLVDPVARLYRASITPALVRVPEMSFLYVDGHGDPNDSPAYATAIQALFAVSYTVKFSLKRSGGGDFKVSPLEGLWWAEDLTAFTGGDKAAWDWRMMIRQPDVVTADLVDRAATEVAGKKDLPTARDMRLTSFEEGPAAQVLHLGPYATEAPTIERVHAFLREQGLTFDGHRDRHHEIYLGDPRRSAPEKLRTLIRQPYAAR